MKHQRRGLDRYLFRGSWRSLKRQKYHLRTYSGNDRVQDLRAYEGKQLRMYQETPFFAFLAHLSRRLIGELIVYQSSRRLSISLSLCVCVCVYVSTLSNMNISATSMSNSPKFYLKHHLGEGLIALCFGTGRIGILVSIATNRSNRVIIGKML